MRHRTRSSRAFTGVGGTRGWLYLGWTRRLRGACDRLFCSVGNAAGRRDADEIRVGEALDFWRVEAIVPGRMMRLRAEMNVPGRAWLQFEVKAQDGDSRPLLIQTAFFHQKDFRIRLLVSPLPDPPHDFRRHDPAPCRKRQDHRPFTPHPCLTKHGITEPGAYQISRDLRPRATIAAA